MLLSRSWYAALALALGAAVFGLFMAVQLYNRNGQHAMAESLSADSSAVGWYLNDDIRARSSALIPMALNPEVRAGLAKASGEAKLSSEVKSKTLAALRKLADEVSADQKFSCLWAVDANGRVIAAIELEQTNDWELGGFPLVADALHGWIRDDAWVWKGRIFRAVARPVEQDVNSEPVGAIVGARIVDDAFANAVSKRTGAAVGFYADGVRVASWAPEGFDASNLDQITQDLKSVEQSKDYQEKGRSDVRILGGHLGVVYARLRGEAWDLGAGYAVGRLPAAVGSPLDFLRVADDADKKAVPTLWIALGAVGVAFLGLLLSWLEHSRPLEKFRLEAARLAGGEVDSFSPSALSGTYKKIASDVNDGIEKVVVKGGGARRAADLGSVLGPIPAQPAMSAFAMPAPAPSEPRRELPKPRPIPPPRPIAAPRIEEAFSAPSAPPSRPKPPLPKASQADADAFDAGLERLSLSDALAEEPASDPSAAPAPARDKAPASEPPARAPEPAPAAAAESVDDEDEETTWRAVYEQFIATKKECGEATASTTYEKFKGTLERNKAALVERHGCKRVRFTVYVKEGKAALKASPVK